MVISCYVEMMLFRRENRYSYWLNISGPYVQRLKESYMEEHEALAHPGNGKL